MERRWREEGEEMDRRWREENAVIILLNDAPLQLYCCVRYHASGKMTLGKTTFEKLQNLTLVSITLVLARSVRLLTAKSRVSARRLRALSHPTVLGGD